MIELKNEHSSFKFEIIGYQFPDYSNEYDGNWLMIKVTVIKDSLKWSKTDPCLFTWEIQEIAEWFDKVANNQKLKSSWIRFTEPSLWFNYAEITNEKVRVSIYFDAELLPPNWDENKECFIDFELTKNELINAGKILRDELKKHPCNAPHLSMGELHRTDKK
jgi:hypothetical protein